MNQKTLKDAVLEGIGLIQHGLVSQGQAVLRRVWQHRKEILKYGSKGIKIVMLILTIFAFPDKVEAAAESLKNLFSD